MFILIAYSSHTKDDRTKYKVVNFYVSRKKAVEMEADKEIITHSGHDTSSQKIIELFCSGESIIAEHDLVLSKALMCSAV